MESPCRSCVMHVEGVKCEKTKTCPMLQLFKAGVADTGGLGQTSVTGMRRTFCRRHNE